MRHRDDPTGRETTLANSTRRRIWYGYGSTGRAEKTAFGRLLNDATRIAAEVAIFGLPTLLYIMYLPPDGWFDAKATGLIALLTMTLVGSLIRIGTVRPLGSREYGWVTLVPWLLVLRVGYLNLGLATAVLGGPVVASATGSVAVGVGWTVAVSTLAISAFPRTAEVWLSLVRRVVG